MADGWAQILFNQRTVLSNNNSPLCTFPCVIACNSSSQHAAVPAVPCGICTHWVGGNSSSQQCATAACALKSVKWPSSAARTSNRAPSIQACAPLLEESISTIGARFGREMRELGPPEWTGDWNHTLGTRLPPKKGVPSTIPLIFPGFFVPEGTIPLIGRYLL